MRDLLAAVEGAAEHSGEWLDGIVSALAVQGAHTASDLDGAKFEDFEFPPATLTGAAKRLVRKAIDKATVTATVAPVTPAGLGTAPTGGEGAAATAATAALAAFLQKEDKKKEEALASSTVRSLARAAARARAGRARRHRAHVGRGAPRPLAAGVLAQAGAARPTAPSRIAARPCAAPK